MSSDPKHVMARRIQREGRYQDFLARMEELKLRGDIPMQHVWKYAAREFNPVDGSPHEIVDLPTKSLEPPLGELDGSIFVDDAPAAVAFVPTVDPLDDELFIDGAEVDIEPPPIVEPVILEPPQPKKRAKKPKPPPEPDPVDDPIAEDYSDIAPTPRDAFESEVFRRLHKKVAKEKIAKPFDEIGWVGANLDEPIEDIHPSDVPSRTALSMLRTAQSSAAARREFMKDQWSKIVPSKAELGNSGSSADKHATQHRLLDDFDDHFHDEVRRSSSVLEEDDGSDS